MLPAPNHADTAALAVVEEPSRAVPLLDPERRRLVEALRERPDSASGLARRLGDSRQRLNYHLRALEEVGLVELAEERRRGNCVERVLRVTARRFLVDPAALGALGADPREVGDRFSAAYLLSLAARAIREVAALSRKAATRRKRLATAGIDVEVRLARPADFDLFADDLARAIARVVAEHHDERAGGRPFRVVAGVYPTGHEEDGAPAENEEGEHR